MKDYFNDKPEKMIPWRGGFMISPMNVTQSQGSILLYHGITGTPKEMQGLAVYLSENGFEVFVPRLSGHNNNIEEFRKIPAKVWIRDAEESLVEIYKAVNHRVSVLGLSFGGLLSLDLAANHADKVLSVAALAPPMKLKLSSKDFLLTILSYFPDVILNLLCLIPKKKRPEGLFVIERDAYKFHAVSATARVVAIRRKVIKSLPQLTCPILVLQDPKDHHLSYQSPEVVLKNVSSKIIEFKWIVDGEHELVISKYYMEVFKIVLDFFSKYKE